jgi:hypothetical protein
LWEYLSHIEECKRQIRPYKTLLNTQYPDELAKAENYIKGCEKFVKDALSKSVRSKRRLEENVAKAIEREAEQTTSLETPEESLLSILEACGLQVPEDIEKALTLFESEILIPNFEKATYQNLLMQFKEELEELS